MATELLTRPSHPTDAEPAVQAQLYDAANRHTTDEVGLSDTSEQLERQLEAMHITEPELIDDAALESFGELLSDSVPDGESIESHIGFYKENGLKLSDEQERTVFNNAEYKKYGREKYISRTIQRDVINNLVKEIALHRISGGQLDDEFIDNITAASQQNIDQLTDFLEHKNFGQFTVSQAKKTAEDYLNKTIKYYSGHDILDTRPAAEKKRIADRLKRLGRGVVAAAATTTKIGGNIIDKVTPSLKTVKKVGSIAAVGSIAPIALVIGLIAQDTLVESKDKPYIEEVADESNESIGMPTISIQQRDLPERQNIVIKENSLSEQETSIIETISEDNLNNNTQEQPAKTLLEQVRAGERTLESMPGVRVGNLGIQALGLDDIDVFVINDANPVENPEIMDGVDWEVLNSPDLPPITPGDYRAAQERLNPLDRVRIDTTPQQPIELNSEKPPRWSSQVIGLVDGSPLVSTLAEIKPAATIHPYSSLPGSPGVKYIEGHRTTKSAPFMNIDTMTVGQIAELSDGSSTYRYRFIESKIVNPDTPVQSILDMYKEQDVLIVSTCESGDSERWLAIFVAE